MVAAIRATRTRPADILVRRGARDAAEQCQDELFATCSFNNAFTSFAFSI
jgi:hypothetical protein